MIDNKIDDIYWILGDKNAVPKNLKIPVKYLDKIPDEFENNSNKPCVVVIDDLMFEIGNKSLANLLTRGSHHQNISVIFITQNLFQQGKYARTISLNLTHLCIKNNPRDRLQFSHLARRLYPENSKELVRIYKEITEEPYSYLFIDLTQSTHNLFRFRTDIFNPNYTTVFCPSIPNVINQEQVENEMCGQGSAYVVCFKEHQL